MDAVCKRSFAASTLEHDASPAAEHTCGDFAGILGWGVGNPPVDSDRRFRDGAYWIKAIAIGALGPSLVAWFVVMPIKGLGPAGGWDPKILIGGLLLNGAWGLGVGLIMRLVPLPW